MVVLTFGARRIPRGLAGLPVLAVDGEPSWDTQLGQSTRVIVIGGAAEVAVVLTRLLRADLLDIEVAVVRHWWQVRRARRGQARRVPLIRDETGTVLVESAHWLPPSGADLITGEAIVDDTVLFDGTGRGVVIEPIDSPPGLRAKVAGRRWVTGRAAQLGTEGARVIRDGVAIPRDARRSTFYRHTQGWLRV